MAVKLSSIPRHTPRSLQCLFVRATSGVAVRQRALADDCRADLTYEHTAQVPLCDLECLCAIRFSCSPLYSDRVAPHSFPGAGQMQEDRTEEGCLRWTVRGRPWAGQPRREGKRDSKAQRSLPCLAYRLLAHGITTGTALANLGFPHATIGWLCLEPPLRFWYDGP